MRFKPIAQDATAADSWSYDGGTRTLSVTLSARPVDAQLELELG
jgi:hypothetical protein